MTNLLLCTYIDWFQTEIHTKVTTVDHVCLLTIMEGYKAGPHMYRLLEVFWHQQEVITFQKGYHVLNFKATRGTTQGRLIFTILINLIVENVARNWLEMTAEDQLVVHEGLELAVGRCMGLFYADNRVVVSWDPE